MTVWIFVFALVASALITDWLTRDCTGRKGHNMKCNIKDSLKRQICTEIAETLDEQRVLWELLTLVVLHDEFGFGQERLERWGNAMQRIYNEFTDESRSTDTPYRKGSKKMSNMDTAIIRRLQGLRSYGIDYRKILGIEDVKVDGENIDAFLDKMGKGRANGT